MKVESLIVEKRPSYDTDFPNQLVGTVKLKGGHGDLTIVLSNGALSRIFGVIAQEVHETASRNAESVKRGMQDAVDEPLMLAAQTLPMA